jgi:hypothetical protein
LHFGAVIRAQCIETGGFRGVAKRLELGLHLGRHAREALGRSRNRRRAEHESKGEKNITHAATLQGPAEKSLGFTRSDRESLA